MTLTETCASVLQVPEPRTDLSVVYLLYNITKAAMLHGAKLEAAHPTLVARGITVAAACPGWCRVRALALSSALSILRDAAPRPQPDAAGVHESAYQSAAVILAPTHLAVCRSPDSVLTLNMSPNQDRSGR